MHKRMGTIEGASSDRKFSAQYDVEEYHVAICKQRLTFGYAWPMSARSRATLGQHVGRQTRKFC